MHFTPASEETLEVVGELRKGRVEQKHVSWARQPSGICFASHPQKHMWDSKWSQGTSPRSVGWRCQGISQMQVLFCQDFKLLTNQLMTDRGRGREEERRKEGSLWGRAGVRAQQPRKQRLEAQVELEICPVQIHQVGLVLFISRPDIGTLRAFKYEITCENNFSC